jgi:hypothetical protein
MWIGDARPFSTASGSQRDFRERSVAGVTLATARGTDHPIQILVCRSSTQSEVAIQIPLVQMAYNVVITCSHQLSASLAWGKSPTLLQALYMPGTPRCGLATRAHSVPRAVASGISVRGPWPGSRSLPLAVLITPSRSWCAAHIGSAPGVDLTLRRTTFSCYITSSS